MPSAGSSSLSMQWCQELLSSPDYVNITTTNRRPPPPGDQAITNRLFSETLNSENTISAWQSLRSKSTTPPYVSPAYILLLSLGPGLDSHKGKLHGGMLGAIIDQATSMCASYIVGSIAVTAELSIRYKKSVPLPSIVLCRAKATKREGRKLWIQCTVEDGGGIVFGEADGLFLIAKGEKL